jgi:hypothetical protein
MDPLHVEYAPWTPPIPPHAAHEEEKGEGAMAHGHEEGEGEHVDGGDQEWEDDWEDDWEDEYYDVPEYDPEEWESEEEWWNTYHYEDEDGHWHEWFPNELTTGGDDDVFYDDHEDLHDGHFHTEF